MDSTTGAPGTAAVSRVSSDSTLNGSSRTVSVSAATSSGPDTTLPTTPSGRRGGAATGRSTSIFRAPKRRE